jgi:hypothetical protein
MTLPLLIADDDDPQMLDLAPSRTGAVLLDGLW